MPNDSPDDKPDHPGVIAPPPLIYAGFLGLGFVLDWFWPALISPQIWVAVGLVCVGTVIAIAAGRQFREAKTNIPPHKPTTAIITGGPFAYSRNPLYLVLTLIHGAVGMAWGNIWVLLLLAPALLVIRYGVIAREERYLEAKFGEEYLAYKRSVRRWI